MQSGATTPAARSAAGAVARLKMNSARMKLKDGRPKTPRLLPFPQLGNNLNKKVCFWVLGDNILLGQDDQKRVQFMFGMIRRTTIDEIEAHLRALGAGNHEDNMKIVREFPRHYLLTLTEPDFRSLVFLQTRKLSKIVPQGLDRRLEAVARRASQLPPPEARLGGNWDIAETVARFRRAYAGRSCEMPAFLLRDTRGSEGHWAEDGWYLQDGSHRALAYCMAIDASEMQYSPQPAFCATSRYINESA